MRTPQILVRLGTSLVCAAGIANAAYSIEATFDSTNFFNEFNFFSGPDPTSGFVDYLAPTAANKTSLAGYSNNAVYLGVDHTTMNPTGGRASVRVSSNKDYTRGLFIADISHMPGGQCGVWPAFWTFGPEWPTSGEIDIIEGVNDQSTNQITLHTSANCSFDGSGSIATSTLNSKDCNKGNGNDGCGYNTVDSQSYGTGFNAAGGGVYAMEWTSSVIRVFFFPRSSIPADVTSGSPDPSTWGTPVASFSGSGCDIDERFQKHNIIFNTTFCGAWAGQVFDSSTTCSALAATCDEYVGKNPEAFVDAYWLINSVKVYQDSGATKRGSVTAVPFLA